MAVEGAHQQAFLFKKESTGVTQKPNLQVAKCMISQFHIKSFGYNDTDQKSSLYVFLFSMSVLLNT